MNATLTGDIVQSRTAKQPGVWLSPLKQLLQKFGETPAQWEIFRGDSFQLKIDAKEALRVAILIKSVIKKLDEKELDVRIAIGIGGDDDIYADRVSESVGEVFVFSGQLLDELKKENIHLGIKTIWPKINKELNMMFKLALVIMNSWTSNTAEVVELLFSHSKITQVEIAKKLGIAQSSVNDRIKRGAVYEIIELEQYYRERFIVTYYNEPDF